MSPLSHEIIEIINRYRTEGFSDGTILLRAMEGGVDESDKALLDVNIGELTSYLAQ